MKTKYILVIIIRPKNFHVNISIVFFCLKLQPKKKLSSCDCVGYLYIAYNRVLFLLDLVNSIFILNLKKIYLQFFPDYIFDIAQWVSQ